MASSVVVAVLATSVITTAGAAAPVAVFVASMALSGSITTFGMGISAVGLHGGLNKNERVNMIKQLDEGVSSVKEITDLNEGTKTIWIKNLNDWGVEKDSISKVELGFDLINAYGGQYGGMTDMFKKGKAAEGLLQLGKGQYEEVKSIMNYIDRNDNNNK